MHILGMFFFKMKVKDYIHREVERGLKPGAIQSYTYAIVKNEVIKIEFSKEYISSIYSKLSEDDEIVYFMVSFRSWSILNAMRDCGCTHIFNNIMQIPRMVQEHPEAFHFITDEEPESIETTFFFSPSMKTKVQLVPDTSVTIPCFRGILHDDLSITRCSYD